MSNRQSQPLLMRRDAYRLRRAKPDDPRVTQSALLREQRQAALEQLDLTVNAQLPLAEHADAVKRLLQSHQVVVLAGETGSGKTTQLPKICMQLGLGAGGAVAHTQPRRLAARTVARRIAAETGAALGQQVGYAVRFSDQTSEQTLVKVMTDGLLLTEIRSDRYLNQYDAVIVDEAHERSLNIDFLLGYLKRLLSRRPDLKVIVTSATIDVQRFSDFFGGAPVVQVGGRTFPVEVRYRDEPVEDPLDAIVDCLEQIDAMPVSAARDVLVFFSGEREIFDAARLLRRQFADRFEVLPLYARLSPAEQQRVFEPGAARRRVVLATNVAETSLTVPNIGFVIDPGLARINRYSYRSKLQRLPVEPISQASADQRMGRCGRVAPGVCFRLYAEADFLARPAYTDPEIRRVNLASVVLQMQAFRLGDINRFGFIDPPDPKAIRDAVRLLEELRAIQDGKLTRTGRAMARLPVDPRLARMLIEADRQGALAEVLIVTSALAAQDPRERPLQKSQAADTAHEMFVDERSDFVTLINLWRWLEEQRQDLTRSRFRTLLRKRFINEARVREWREMHRQLLITSRELKLRLRDEPASYQAMHESILAGSLSLIAMHEERGRYLGPRNLKLRIFPGSGLGGRTPRWIVSGEVVETSRVYARTVAAVEPAWIERQGAHLLRRNYSAPFWSLKRGETMAHMNVSLYGLRLAERREVSMSKIDPAQSRDLMLREGLIRGHVEKPPEFLQHNLAVVAGVEDLEAKGRRRDLMVSDDEIYDFYARRIPNEVVRMADLTRWLKKLEPAARERLLLQESDLLQRDDVRPTEVDFPGQLVVEDISAPLKYRFAPGADDDGVTLRLPVGLLPAINPEALEWGVPGLFPNLIEQWLRTLPKQKRKVLVPLPDTVAEISGELLKPAAYRHGRLLSALGALLSQRYRLQVAESDWDRTRVDEHLLMRVEVLSPDGRVLAAGRNLRSLKRELTGQASQDGPAQEDMERTGLTVLDDVQLVDQHISGSGAAGMVRYPGLVDRGDSVDLRLFADRGERDAAHRRGLCRLALLRLGKTGSYFRKELDRHPQLGLHFAALGNAAQLKDEVLRNVVWFCFFADQTLPRDQAEFDQRLKQSSGELAGTFTTVVDHFAEILALRFQCMRALESLQSKAYAQARADIEDQLQRLVPVNVLEQTPAAYLPLVVRDLQGALWRIEHLPGHVPQDLRKIKELRPLCDRLDRIRSADLAEPAHVCALQFLLEELRLVEFAQPIARQKLAPHPLDGAYFGAAWKASFKRVGEELLREEQRLGLA